MVELPERFERKYYVAPADVGVACGLLRQAFPPAAEYPFEQIHSLYFDTADLEQYERSDSGDYRKDKVRIRWYGPEDGRRGLQPIFLELKSRRGFSGTKQRLKLQVPVENLVAGSLIHGVIPGTLLLDALARFGFFPSGMLLPAVRISYWRYRFCEAVTRQRVSLDLHIRSAMLRPGPVNGESELELPGGVIEIKGRTMETPLALRRGSMLDLDWSRFSKYSACIEAHGERPGTVGRMSPSGRLVQVR